MACVSSVALFRRKGAYHGEGRSVNRGFVWAGMCPGLSASGRLLHV